ncbi:recombinase family protein [Micromonospora sediminicola]|uniref:recombinase family protein n=1 Tax=Micromonospora sediminicola TaxID=946078 RepID=UPI00378E9A68
MSTVEFQDRVSSCRWQCGYAEDLVAGHGRIVVEFFDEGVSRRIAWPDRPQAARLLAALADPARGFDAIVVGEYERAFHGQQLEQMTPTLLRHGVQLWLPETYGPVDFNNPRQLALLDLLGVHSQREVSRAQHRTTAALRAQAELQGRHLGGRPPYGYRLVDAGLIRTAPTPPGDAVCTAWNPTRPPPRTSGGSSSSGSPAAAWPASQDGRGARTFGLDLPARHLRCMRAAPSRRKHADRRAKGSGQLAWPESTRCWASSRPGFKWRLSISHPTSPSHCLGCRPDAGWLFQPLEGIAAWANGERQDQSPGTRQSHPLVERSPVRPGAVDSC